MSQKERFSSILPEKILEHSLQNGFTRNQAFKFCRTYFRKTENLKDISGLSKPYLAFLEENYAFDSLEILSIRKDEEGNGKIAFKTLDGHIIESVFIKREEFTSICISTQVGCKMNCAFCATAKLGFIRNLETWEMIEQVRLTAFQFLGGKRPLTHVTIMGMGEPFENFENMYQAFLIMIDPFAFSVGAKKVTVATMGYLPGLTKLLRKKITPSVTFSIHAPTQELREKLLPVSKTYPLAEILDFVKHFPRKKNKRISIQYMLLKGVNDSSEHAEQLGMVLKGLPVKINFLRYNEVSGVPFEASDEEVRSYFINRLRELGFTSLKRRSMGAGIKAACGQLGLELLEERPQ